MARHPRSRQKIGWLMVMSNPEYADANAEGSTGYRESFESVHPATSTLSENWYAGLPTPETKTQSIMLLPISEQPCGSSVERPNR
jgi:hypothetical protein